MVELDECDVGLFTFNGELCLKTEYRKTVDGGGSSPECYIVDSGEFFAGGVSAAERGRLLVRPVTSVTLAERG